MLLVRVFVDAGLVPTFDPRPYPQDWHLHRDDERYLGFVFERATEVEHPQPGDVVVFRYGRAYAHRGIVTATEPLTLVHAFSPAQAVIEEPIMRNPVLAEPGRPPPASSASGPPARPPRPTRSEAAMSLFGGKQRTVRPDYTGLQVQTASSALPIPVVYGTNRIAPNVIWSDGFQTHAQRGKKAGGKGGGRHGGTGYTYSTWIMFGLAEGPVQGIGEVLSGQSVTPFPTNFLSLIPGDTPQRPWGPALARYPAAAPPYNGTAYLASPDFDLGSSATISSIAFEVVGRLAGTAGPLGQDDSAWRGDRHPKIDYAAQSRPGSSARSAIVVVVEARSAAR